MYLYYASRDGQAKRIAERIASRLAGSGHPVTPQNVAMADVCALKPDSLVVLVAAVRYGRHLKEADRFLASLRREAMPRLVFLSVNLTARKPDKKTADRNPYLKKTLRRHGLKPVLASAIAGMLDYPRYTPFDRFMIRLIMTMTAGPTDPTATVEFTDWNQVDALAGDIAVLAASESAAR
jgi:menaquinone-dependent protoporphyrinogen oxidase